MHRTALRAALTLAALAVIAAGCTTAPVRRSAVTHPTGPPAPAHTVAAGNLYAAVGANMLSPAVRDMPYRLYVPESASSYVDVIDPATYKVVDRYRTGLDPQHVVPAWDLKTLYDDAHGLYVSRDGRQL
jgi:DNA-binding beta-propeller fold protein YncE